MFKENNKFRSEKFFFDEKNPKFEKKLEVFEKSCVFTDGSLTSPRSGTTIIMDESSYPFRRCLGTL